MQGLLERVLGEWCCGEGCPKRLALQGGASPRGQEPLSRALLHP